MARTGDEFRMPDGSRSILRTPSAQADGDYVGFDTPFPRRDSAFSEIARGYTGCAARWVLPAPSSPSELP
jgi:hypothetical protein